MRERRVACLDSRFRRLVAALSVLWGVLYGFVRVEEVEVRGVLVVREGGFMGACGF